MSIVIADNVHPIFLIRICESKYNWIRICQTKIYTNLNIINK